MLTAMSSRDELDIYWMGGAGAGAVRFVGVGEKMSDRLEFWPAEFVVALVG